MAEGRDFSQELFGESAASGRDLSGEIFQDTVHDRVLTKAKGIREAGLQRTAQGLSLGGSPGLGLLRPFMGERTGAAGPPGHAITVEGYTAPVKGALPMAGQLAGGVTGPFRVYTAPAGAGLGLLVERWIRDEPVTAPEVAKEVLFSFAPEAAESMLRAGVRTVGRATRGAQELRLDEAARRAAGAAPQVFQAPERQAVSTLFEQVRQSGVQLQVDELANWLQRLRPEQLHDLVNRDVRAIDIAMRSGGRFESLVTDLATAPRGRIPAVDIGTLQSLRSHLLARTKTVPDPAAKSLLSDFQQMVDSATDMAPALVQGHSGQMARETVTLLQDARRQWAQVRSAEDLAEILTTGPVSKVTQGGRMHELRLDALMNKLQDQRDPLVKSVLRSLEQTPGAAERFQAFLHDLQQLVPAKTIPISDVSGLRRLGPVGAIDRAISHVLVSPLGQELFREAILQGRGTLSVNLVANMVSAIRRAEWGQAIPGFDIGSRREQSPGP